MSLRFITARVLSIVCLAVPAWADFQAGMDAYNRKDYTTALREWQPLAEQGDTGAQYYIGVLYDYRKGVPQDLASRGSGTIKPPRRGTRVPRTTSEGCMNSDTA